MRYLILLLLFVSCNPVKQVLKDPVKFDQVAREVVKRGYCINDTILSFKSDTVVSYDTSYVVREWETVLHDTLKLNQYKDRIITKTITIHDTTKVVVRDDKLETILRGDVSELNTLLAKEKQASQAAKSKANKYLLWLIILGLAGLLSHIIRSKI